MGGTQSLISDGLASACHTERALASQSLKAQLNKVLQSVPLGGSSSVPSWGGTSKSLWSSQPFWSNFSLVFNCKLCLPPWLSVTFNKCFNGNRQYCGCIYVGWNSLNHDSLRGFSHFFGRRDFYFLLTCTKAIDYAMALKSKPQL